MSEDGGASSQRRPSFESPADPSYAELVLPKLRTPADALSASSTSDRPTATPPARLTLDGTATLDTPARDLRSPIIPEHEHGMGASGLRRIRQQPTTRTSLTTGQSLSAGPSRSNSMTALSLPLSRNPSSTGLAFGPTSPTLNFSEDLHRFPTESLHSFSFAQQSEDSIHNRQNVLKRSIDFMRDRLNWAGTNVGIAQAQAKISGDQEMQSMMELLARAKLIGHDSLPGFGLGLSNATMTGPPEMSGENIFEKSFLPRSESPKIISPTEAFVPESKANAATALAEDIQAALDSASGHSESAFENLKSMSTDSYNNTRPPSPGKRRAALKRTFTDLAPLSIQGKLTDALAQPYRAQDFASTSQNHSHELLSPRQLPTIPHALSSTANSAPHGHSSRGAQAAQAVFTTESLEPWTITSANDLACLVFGVTRAEMRRMGILEVVHESRRAWLEQRLREVEPTSPIVKAKSSLHSETQRPTPASTPSPTSPLLGNSGGITAKLLSKPNSRVTGQGRRVKSAGEPIAEGTAGSASAPASLAPKTALHHAPKRSRGVLLCGDVVPIQKRDGSLGSASLWVKEKRGGLIWVLEEIAEDVSLLTVDEVGCVTKSSGAVEAIFGLERVRRGMDIARLIPQIPRLPYTNTGALDFEGIATVRRFTARTSNSISIPISVDQMPGQSTFRISSFPHIAGIMVLNSASHNIESSNSAFSGALFGLDKVEGLPIDSLIPNFGRLLKLMVEEDNFALTDGIVIPEHSFRRARALLALREGSEDAAAAFLRPSGLPARHRTGSEIMVDVQMRVVKSERLDSSHLMEDVIIEADEQFTTSEVDVTGASSQVVYALWITYSRQLHAANHGIGPVTPMVSRPATPPMQPLPHTTPARESGNGAGEVENPPLAVLKTEPEPIPAAAESTNGDEKDGAEPMEHPGTVGAAGLPRVKKAIADFNILEDMGQGAYGQVKLCRYKRHLARKMVIKYVTKRRILVDTWTRDRRLGTVPLEIHVLDFLRRGDLKHPNIVEMADFFEDDINYYIEMVPHGLPGMDLFDYIELRVNMDEDECRKIFVQVANAIHHLHTKAKVVHRDIKDENVILDGEGNIKLIDFGSAAYIKSGPFDVFVGTIDYAAPEVLAGRPYRGKEQDVWALGILLYTIVYKENPFYSIDEIMDHDLRVPYVLSDASINLIRLMLNRDVDQRTSINKVLEHPWCQFVPESDRDNPARPRPEVSAPAPPVVAAAAG